MKKQRSYSKYAEEAALLLGRQIKLGRKRRKWSEANLAERVGISRATLQKIEKGDMSCSLGLYFEAAALVDVKLFEQDNISRKMYFDNVNDKLALLPKRIREKTKVVADDF